MSFPYQNPNYPGYPYYLNTYQQPQMPQQNQLSAPYQSPQQTQPAQTNLPMQNGGFAFVRSEQEARDYPVAPGNYMTFKDEHAPYLYEKSKSYSQLDEPTFEKYRLIKEGTQPQEEAPQAALAVETPHDGVEPADFVKLSDEVDALRDDLEEMRTELETLRRQMRDPSDKKTGRVNRKEAE